MVSRADILLVEDEPAIIDFMERVLRRAGYTVRAVTDGVAAVATVADAPPDVMILDLVLPTMNGWAVLEQLHREQCSVPVVVMTANPTAAARLLAYDIERCLIKPFLIGELLDAVAAAHSAPHRC
jgi:DNA-binding response OmpR family regulator